MHRNSLAAAAAVALIAGLPAEAAQQISWWHAMTGANSEVVTKIATDFNASQSDYKVVPVFKGTYPETLNAGIAAFRAGQAPDILQVFDVGTGVMMAAEGAVKPVAEILRRGASTFDKEPVSARHRRLLLEARRHDALVPLQLVLADPLLQQGHLPEGRARRRQPAQDLERGLGRGEEDQGVGRRALRLHLDLAHLDPHSRTSPPGTTSSTPPTRTASPAPKSSSRSTRPLFVDHFQAIADLAKDGTFKYGGRTSEAKQIFLAGECGIFTESSGGLGDIVKSGMNYGIGQLPYDSDAPGAPQNTIPGGASLWVFGGKSDEIYKGVADLLRLPLQTEVQEYLHQTSGYLPVTLAAYEATKASGFYDKNPGRETPILQMMGKAPTENSKGVRLVNLPQVRDIQNEEFETMLAGNQTAQQALDNAVKRANEAISQALGN